MTAHVSFEFYPPKTDEQRTQLDRAAARLKAHAPEYVSCTFGAGGSTLSYTSETVRHLNQHHGFEAAPHLSCVGGNREEIRELLKLYRAIGCRRTVEYDSEKCILRLEEPQTDHEAGREITPPKDE